MHWSIRAVASIFFFLVLPGVASCRQGSLPPPPERNPDPKHVVTISGRLPPSLEIEMFANYSIDNIHTGTGPAYTPVDEGCTPSTIGGLIPTIRTNTGAPKI